MAADTPCEKRHGRWAARTADPVDERSRPDATEAMIGELQKKTAAELGWSGARTTTKYPSLLAAALDGSGRRLGVERRAGRLCIAGVTPKGCEEQAAMPSVGVDAVRSPQVIAAEIRRRLLPAYDAAVRDSQGGGYVGTGTWPCPLPGAA
jgi:hypothetical protein